VPIPQLTNTATELRKTDRFPVMREVQLRTSDNQEFSALCTDVNLSGIGLDSERLLRVGQRIELLIKSKDGSPGCVPMMVIYRMGKHYGLSALASLEEILELLPVQG
jgi:hypothetical protein